MLDLRNVGQMFGLEVHHVPFTVNLPLIVPISQHPKDLEVIRLLMELIKDLRVNQFEVIVPVDRLHTEVYQHPAHPNLFQYMGGKIGVKFSYHTYGS